MSEEFIVPAGKIIKEYLEERSISQKDLAVRLGMSEKHICNMLSGKSRLTEDVAIKLETIMKDIPASYWLNLESKYREYLARDEASQKLTEASLADIPVRFHFEEVFGGLGWSLQKQAQEMLKLLGISDFANFDKAYQNLEVKFMEEGGEKEAIAIWLKLCEEEIDIQNEDIENITFNMNHLKKNLPQFQQFAQNKHIEGITENSRELCNKLGIYLVICPAITDCKVRGALTTIKGHPAIYLSDRAKTHDDIWFAFMHEIGHLLYHYDKKSILVSFDKDTGDIGDTGDTRDTEDTESEANAFARNFLNKDFSS